MSNTQTPIGLTANIRKLDNHCLDVDASVMRFKSSVTSSPKSFGTGDIGLSTNEVKALHKSMLRKFVRNEDIVTRINNDKVLVKESAGKEGVFTRLVILTIYEGNAPIPTALTNLDYTSVFFISPESDDANEGGNAATASPPNIEAWARFKRSSLPSGTEPSSHRRWMRIHGIQCAESKLRYLNDNAVSNMEGVRFYVIPMNITCRSEPLRQALEMSSNIKGNDPAVGVSLPKFLELGGELDNFLSESSQSRDLPGVQAFNASNSHVRLNHDSDLVLSEASHVRVYLKCDHKTLSDVVVEHCSAVLHRLQSSEGIEMLTSKFKGVQVGKRTSGGYEYRTIRAFRMGTASDMLPRERHNAWPSEGGLMLSPSLPLVDVGTVGSPLYLPMEVCHIPEKQALHGPRDHGLTQWVNATIHTNSVTDLPVMCESVLGNLIFHSYPKENGLEERLVSACDGESPNLLFVEAGPTVNDGAGWSKLRSELRDSFYNNDSSAAVMPLKDDSMPLLTLRYTSGSDPSIRWTRQLHDFVAACDMSKQKPIIIVWLESERDHNVMYKTIKKACGVAVGAQTFFVKRETYATQDYSNSDFKRSIADIRLRICQKNPPRMLKIMNGSNPRLAISMHIAQVPSSSKRIRSYGNQQGSSSVYLVTFVSRDPISSRYYHTEQDLFSESQIRACEHVKLLGAFLEILPNLTPQNVVILRSGTMLLPRTHTSASIGGFDLTNSDSFNAFDPPSNDVEIDNIRPSTSPQHFDPSEEIQAIRKLFGATKPGNLTFITLAEDKILATRLDLPTYYAARPEDKASAVLFIQDQLLVKSEDRIVKVQQIPHSLLEQGQETSDKTIQTRPGAITATFYYSRQTDSEGLQELNSGANKSLTLPRSAGKKKTSTTKPRRDSQGKLIPMRRSSHPLEPARSSGTMSPASIFHSPQPHTPIRGLEDSPFPSAGADSNDLHMDLSNLSVASPMQAARSKK